MDTTSGLINYNAPHDPLGLAIRTIVPHWNAHSSDLEYFINNILPIHTNDPEAPRSDDTDPTCVHVRALRWADALESVRPEKGYSPVYETQISSVNKHAEFWLKRFPRLKTDPDMNDYLKANLACPLNDGKPPVDEFGRVEEAMTLQDAGRTAAGVLCALVRRSLTKEFLSLLLAKAREMTANVDEFEWLNRIGETYTTFPVFLQSLTNALSDDRGMDSGAAWPTEVTDYMNLIGALQLILDVQSHREDETRNLDGLGHIFSNRNHWSPLWDAVKQEMDSPDDYPKPLSFFYRHLRLASAMEKLTVEEYERIYQSDNELVKNATVAIRAARQYYNIEVEDM